MPKISELPEYTGVITDAETPIIIDGVSYKIPISKINETFNSNPVLEAIPNKSELKLCCDSTTIPQGSWDNSSVYIPRWDSALGLPDRLDYMYPTISSQNTNTPRRVMDPYLGPTMQFGAIGGYAGYLASTWVPTGAFTITVISSNTLMSEGGQLFYTSTTGYLIPHWSLGARWMISGVAHKTTGWPAGQNTIANLSKAHVMTFQYDPTGTVSKAWFNGTVMADTDLSGMPALTRLIIGGAGNWQCNGIYVWDGLNVDGLEIHAWAKAKNPHATF